ncbi:hypothetical protein V9T40_003289 [Parthenolecanium corni]|uniref:Uncharacterized protein n=1 Tax=Parthenolecanium corni TaxID=536013 RepID=A0AAN9YAA0_9HEMI
MWITAEHLPADRNRSLWFSIYEPRPTLLLLVHLSFVFENLQPPAPSDHPPKPEPAFRQNDVEQKGGCSGGCDENKGCATCVHIQKRTSFGIVKKKEEGNPAKVD